MVNYKLSVKDGKKFQEIIWNKDSYSRFNNHRLKDIDDFTSLFDDEMNLKKELIEIDAFAVEDLSKKVGIRYFIKGHISLLQYGLVLKDDAKFLDVDFIKTYLKVMKKDIVLLEKLCNHYRNSYINGRNINIIRDYINKVLNNEINDNLFQKLEVVLDNFVNRQVFLYDACNSKYVVDEFGNKRISYKNLHDLAIFLSYDNKKRLNPEIYERQNQQEIEKVKVKTRPKKNDQFPGQYSLFD